MVQIVAILTSLAFAGVIFVVLGLILFGGGGNTAADDILSDAKKAVEQSPTSADAYEDLASAYRGKDDLPNAIIAARKAVSLDPNDLGRVQTLVTLQVDQGNTEGVLTTLQNFTKRNPKNADAFLLLAQQAEAAGRTPLARLSYLTFLRLAPDDPNAEAIRQRITELDATGATTG